MDDRYLHEEYIDWFHRGKLSDLYDFSSGPFKNEDLTYDEAVCAVEDMISALERGKLEKDVQDYLGKRLKESDLKFFEECIQDAPFGVEITQSYVTNNIISDITVYFEEGSGYWGCKLVIKKDSPSSWIVYRFPPSFPDVKRFENRDEVAGYILKWILSYTG